MAARYLEAPLSVDLLVEIPSVFETANRFLGNRTVHLASERFITVAEQGDQWSQSTVTFLDISDPVNPKPTISTYRKHNGGERLLTASQSPNGKYCMIQLLNNHVRIVDVAEKLAPLPVTHGYVVQHVTWLNDNEVAIVKEQEIVHKNIHNLYETKIAVPQLIRKDYAVVSYQTDNSVSGTSTWSLASTVKVEKQKVKGLLFGFRVKTGAFVQLNGFAGAFIPAPVKNNSIGAGLIVADLTGDKTINVRIMELEGTDAATNQGTNAIKQIITYQFDIPNPQEGDPAGILDIPISVKVSARMGLAFVVTKLGRVHMVDYIGGCYLGSKQITARSVCSVISRKDGGLLLVDGNGMVRSVKLSSDFLSFVCENAGEGVAIRHASWSTEAMQQDLFLRLFRHAQREQWTSFALLNFAKLNVEQLPANEAFEVMRICYRSPRLRLHDFVMLAGKMREKIGVERLVEMFEEDKSGKGLFQFLQQVGPTIITGESLRKYVKVALKLGHIDALLHFVKLLHVADPSVVRDCFLEFPDPHIIKPLMEALCTKYKMPVDLVVGRGRVGAYLSGGQSVRTVLFQANGGSFRDAVELFLKTDMLVADLFYCFAGVDCSPFQEGLIDELEANDQKEILQKFLELLVMQGDRTQAVHSELLKRYIALPLPDKMFSLLRMRRYDAAEVGKWCEENDSPAALLIYEYAECDDDYLRITNKRRTFSKQLEYLLKRQQQGLWDTVFRPTNEHREELVLELLECSASGSEVLNSFAQVSEMAQSLVRSDLAAETLNVLDRLILRKFTLEQTALLQKLAVQCLLQQETNPDGLSSYLENCSYDPRTVAACLKENGRHELALKVLSKGECWTEALEILISDVKDEARMKEFTEKCSNPQAYSRLADFFLDQERLLDALEYYHKARNYTQHDKVYKLAAGNKTFDGWDLLIDYLQGARRTSRDPQVNSALAVAYGRSNRFEELKKHFETALEESVQETQGCRICEGATKEITFVPCGHMVACGNCSQFLAECPICRKPITSKQRVYNVA